MSVRSQIVINPPNAWRAETPGGSEGWARTPYPGRAQKKYFIVSCDTHIEPPSSLMRERIEPEFRDRLPRMQRDENGVMWAIVEDARPQRIVEADMEGEDAYRSKAGAA